MALTIIAQIEANQGKEAFIKEELLKLIAPTKKEAGCLEYRLQADNENPTKFIFVEKWENRELWQAHMESEHLKNLVKVTEGALAGLVIHEMSEIG